MACIYDSRKNIYKNGGASLKTFASEGLYPTVGNSQAEKLDNWTDSLMVLLAMYEKKMQLPLNRAMAVYQPVILSEDADPVTVSFAYVKWQRQHGETLVIHDTGTGILPFCGHYFLSPATMESALLITLVSSCCWSSLELLYGKKILPRYCSFAFNIPVFAAAGYYVSLQFSTVYYPTMLTILLLTLLGSKAGTS